MADLLKAGRQRMLDEAADELASENLPSPMIRATRSVGKRDRDENIVHRHQTSGLFLKPSVGLLFAAIRKVPIAAGASNPVLAAVALALVLDVTSSPVRHRVIVVACAWRSGK